jgi:hypothetical protein
MVAVLIAAFLIGAPLIALITWRLTFANTFSTTDAVHDGWHPVSAVLLADEPNWNGVYAPPVPARWAGPDGVLHTGQVVAPPGARAGSRAIAWTDRAGHLAGTPMSPRQAVTQADLAAAVAVPIWVLALLSSGLLGHNMLEHRRLAGWEIDWRTSDLSGPAGASPGR